MKWQLIFLVFLLFPIISATCEDGQIDINSASLIELQIFKGIGPSKAQSIIDSRPFNSVEDLIIVSGIGPVTLENIKNGGACVNDEKELKVEEPFEEEKEVVIEDVIIEEVAIIEEKENKVLPKLEQVSFNPQVIKTDNSEESYNVYAILGLVTFSVLLVLLFMLSKLKEDKNEFS